MQKKIENDNIEDVLKTYGVEYTGKGPKEAVEGAVTGLVSETESDPLKDLGYGFEAYWNLLQKMSCLFFLMTFIFVP